MKLRFFINAIFGLGKELRDIDKRVNRVQTAAMNGDAEWMLTCKPKIDIDTIKCNDNHTYASHGQGQ